MGRIAWMVGAAVVAAVALARAASTDEAEPLLQPLEPRRMAAERPVDPLFVDLTIIEESHGDGGYWYWLRHPR